jgi:hypothetical protein
VLKYEKKISPNMTIHTPIDSSRRVDKKYVILKIFQLIMVTEKLRNTAKKQILN